MSVVTAGVHFPGMVDLVFDPCFFFDRQRIHIRAQSDRLQTAIGRLASLDHPNHARAPQPDCNLIAAELTQPIGDESRRAVHVVHEFGMRVQIAAPAHDVGLQIGDAVDDGHDVNLSIGLGKHKASTGLRQTQYLCKLELHRFGLYSEGLLRS